MCIFINNDDLMGKNIKYLRNKKRLSRVKFAELVGLHKLDISCIERDLTREIPIKAITAICELCNVSSEDLFLTDLTQKK